MITSVKKICDFAVEHGICISPYENLDNRVAKMIEKGHCLCDEERLECPCFQATIEVEKLGKCKCNMFLAKWYYDELIRRREEHNKTGKWEKTLIMKKE